MTVADRDFPTRALAGLLLRQRTVLVPRGYTNLSEVEIADVLGRSVGAMVKSQASRGLARLRVVAVPNTEPTGGQMRRRLPLWSRWRNGRGLVMNWAVADEQPPGNLTELVRGRHRVGMWRGLLVAGAASAPSSSPRSTPLASARVLGHVPGAGPAAGHHPAASTAYVEFQAKLAGTIVPISTANNKPGKPIHAGGLVAITPDGKTLDVSAGAETIPGGTATGQARHADPHQRWLFRDLPGRQDRLCRRPRRRGHRSRQGHGYPG